MSRGHLLVPDINVLLAAYFQAAPHHRSAEKWLDSTLAGNEWLGVPDVVLSRFVRIATNKTVFATPATANEAFTFCDDLRGAPRVIRLDPTDRQWERFRRLVIDAKVVGPRVSDAFLAAFALDRDATFVTFDRDFRRFEGLRLHQPE